MRTSNERGIAMITTLLVMMLISALLVGFTTVVMSDQRYRFIDRDRGQAFYAASGGMEKLTADLGNLFFAFVAPNAAQVTALTSAAPSIQGVTFAASATPTNIPASQLSTDHCQQGGKTVRTVGGNGYTIMFCGDAAGNPTVSDDPMTVATGPYEGLTALQTPYQLDVTAKTSTGGEVHLIRTVEAVAIPVFQFGTFSDVDLAFFAGPNFAFGGRVHTNGNLFLSEGGGATLTLANQVTVVKEVVRQRLQNGVSIDVAPTHTGVVNMAKAPGLFRALDRTEGSVVDGLGSTLNDPTWHTISLSTYNSYIRNGRTGAKVLNLPLLTVGGTNPDLVRRPPVGEDVTNNVLFNERLYTKASLRILLSDKAIDITNLPTVTVTAPVQLDGDWRTTAPNNGNPYGPVDGTHPPAARSLGPVPVTATTAATAAAAATISVTAVPPMFQKPQLWVKNGPGTTIVGPITCTTWTETQFQQCTVPGATNLVNGWTIYIAQAGTATLAPGNMPGNANPSATLNGNVNVGANRTLSLNAGQRTWAFAANTFFLNDVNGTGATTQVTCTGATINTFTGCTGVPATAAGATVTTSYLSNLNTGTIGGFLKIEMQDTNSVWRDVTMEILNYGMGGPNLAGAPCGDPTPNAILRIQRLRDNGAAPSCPIGDTLNSYEWWPNVLFDTREALQRDNAPANLNNLYLGGAMYYLAIDTANLARWFQATAPFNASTGVNAKKDNGGFTVYFSDRRNNRNASSLETAEYGWEDFVNPLSATGAPNNVLDPGEDLNANTVLDVYGAFPNYNGTYNQVPPGAAAPLDLTARPTSVVNRGHVQVNRSILFRHALKLINGSNIRGLGVTGLTVVSENPVYVEGDWNASNAAGGWVNPDAATSVIADAVTLLSNNWTDNVSFAQPYTPGNRNRGTPSWYRLAIIGGKGAAFTQPAGTATDFGTDGGAHNFLRYLENGDQPVNYQGAIATFFYNRQAVGTYKCCNTVYGAPQRNYSFDVNFQTPALLPPNTPVFRDMNAVGFSQELRPGR